MNFDKWAKGKNLKPFMCLVKILRGNFLARYDEEKTLDRLQLAFPYYDREELLRLIREVVSYLRKPGKSDSELSKWYNYFYCHRYRDEIEKVSSPVLYHFLQKEYLLSSLENRFLYPTILSLNEYVSRPPAWIPDTLRPAELEKKTWHESWRQSAMDIRRYRAAKAKTTRLNNYLSGRSFLPAINCFTELPIELVQLHADHYGSYGLAFQKTELVAKGYYLDREREPENKRFLRPIYYYDRDVSSLVWMIFEQLSRPSLSNEEKRRLVVDLSLLKPVVSSLLIPQNIYSVIHEREWRYVSFDSVFQFKRSMIHRVLISKADYEKWLNGAEDDTLAKILQYCAEDRFIVDMV